MILPLFMEVDGCGEPQRCLESNPHHVYSGAAGAAGHQATGAERVEAVC